MGVLQPCTKSMRATVSDLQKTEKIDSGSSKQKKPQSPSAAELRRDFEFMPATLEVLDRPPAPFSRAMLIFIVVFAAFLIGWSWYAKMDIVVNGMGVVIPKGKVKVVQPLETGIVTTVVFILIAVGAAFSWLITFAQIPDQVLPIIFGENPSATYTLYVITVIFFIACMFIDSVVAMATR